MMMVGVGGDGGDGWLFSENGAWRAEKRDDAAAAG